MKSLQTNLELLEEDYKNMEKINNQNKFIMGEIKEIASYKNLLI
jgi:hypothetical protein